MGARDPSSSAGMKKQWHDSDRHPESKCCVSMEQADETAPGNADDTGKTMITPLTHSVASCREKSLASTTSVVERDACAPRE